MRTPLNFLPSILLILCFFIGSAQDKKAGPIIQEYGKVWQIDQVQYKTDSEHQFKAVFDVMSSPDSHEVVNPAIETVARYLNMHAQSGVPVENLNAALIIHNKASKDVMSQEAYHSRYGAANPNQELIEKLMEAGVEVIFCGQSSVSRGIPRENVIPNVKISLSAMTALIQLQDQGYQLIKF